MVLSTVLWAVPVPSKWLSEVRSIVRRFVTPFWPTPSSDTMFKKLPKLVPNPRWSPYWLLHLLLSDYLLHNLPISGRISNVIPSSLPPQYILSNIAIWKHDNNQLVVRTTTSTGASAVIRELFPSSGQADATIRFDWLLRPPYRVAPGLLQPVSSWKGFWTLIFQSLPLLPGGDCSMIVYSWHPHFTGETFPRVLPLYAVSVIVMLMMYSILWWVVH
ncbi:hypothetical protein G6F36_012917 [Rhizopus arrhizus]|nr:hypothetical protein G6F36_012917 [Rhizopus arrhizus]